MPNEIGPAPIGNDSAVEKIDVDQLRRQIGSPPADPTDPAGVTDPWLQRIIDRKFKNAEVMIDEMVSRMAITGEGLPIDRAEEITIELDPHTPNISKGSLPDDYVPRSAANYGLDEQNVPFDNKQDLEKEVIFSLFELRLFAIRGREVFVTPEDSESIRLWLVPESTAADFARSRIYEKLNVEIVKEAYRMYINGLKENERQKLTDD